MTRIIGILNNDSAPRLVKIAISLFRGIKNFYSTNYGAFASLGENKQPLVGRGVFVGDCEIYNIGDLNNKYKLNAKSSNEVVFKLIEKRGLVDELDGVFAFAYINDGMLYLMRDIVGVKPLYYSHVSGFVFASEKKMLEKLGYLNVKELNPRKIAVYDIRNDRLRFIERKFFSIMPEHKKSFELIKEDLKRLLIRAIKKRLPNERFGILFSGGLDSSLIAAICNEFGADFVCYTVGFDKAEDLSYAKSVADKLGLKLKLKKMNLPLIENYIKKVVPLIEDTNVVKVSIGLVMYAVAQIIDCKIAFSGLGSEELFAGYQRHRCADVNKACLEGLLTMYKRDTYRDNVIAEHNNLVLRTPFLDKQLIEYALRIPAEYKLSQQDKLILRSIAKDYDIPQRKKRAAQYGSRFDKAIEKLAKIHGYKYKSCYVKQFYHNLRLASIFDSGKDSCYATYVMQQNRYPVICLITIKNGTSISNDLVGLQTKAMNLPSILVNQDGKELKLILNEIKKKYKLDGIIIGTFKYQKEIDKVAKELNLKTFYPLYNLNQETELHELIDNNFEIIFSAISSPVLPKEWVGKKITKKTIEMLVKLNKKFGINIGGNHDYETLVLDAPMFNKKIKLLKYKTVKDEHGTKIVIKNAKLVEKPKLHKF